MTHNGITPDVISFNTAMKCMASGGDLKGAESLLDDMKKMGIRPNILTYNTLLKAFVSQISKTYKNHQSGSARAERLIGGVEKMFEGMLNDQSIEVDIFTYNIMLDLYSRLGAVNKAENLLRRMLQEDSRVPPDSASLNTVIKAYANSGNENAAEQAEAILDQMLSQRGGATPDTATFNSVMSAWINTRKQEAADRCQQLFHRMKTDSTPDVQPDIVTYNLLLRALIFSPNDDAPDQAETIFLEMLRKYEAGHIHLRPTAKTYGSLVHVWSKCKRSDAGVKAGYYLRKIVESCERRNSSPSERPRIFEFTAALQAWANSGDPRAPYMADEVFYLLLQNLKDGNKQLRPDVHFFGALLRIIASSKIPNKSFYANKIVQMMKDFKVPPNRLLLQHLQRCSN
jgi:pentatricopeptide repeat protein